MMVERRTQRCRLDASHRRMTRRALWRGDVLIVR
jgi:hypothetical protein